MLSVAAAAHGHNAQQVASTLIDAEQWRGIGLPDFIGEGSGDQVAINGAMCAAKRGSFDGTGCVGIDEAVTGTVSQGSLHSFH